MRKLEGNILSKIAGGNAPEPTPTTSSTNPVSTAIDIACSDPRVTDFQVTVKVDSSSTNNETLSATAGTDGLIVSGSATASGSNTTSNGGSASITSAGKCNLDLGGAFLVLDGH